MTTLAPFTLQTGLFFRRKLLETLRQPVWIITGLTTPVLYLVLFAPFVVLSRWLETRFPQRR